MVNTFLVYPNFTKSARTLDDKRLFKQVVEAKQIIECILAKRQGKEVGFANHPAVIQWERHLNCLKYYYNCHLRQVLRKAKWNTSMKFYKINNSKIRIPWFVKCPHFYYSHRASLLRKDPIFYSQKYFLVPDAYHDVGYFWPSHHTLSKRKEIQNNLNKFKRKLSKLLTNFIQNDKMAGIVLSFLRGEEYFAHEIDLSEICYEKQTFLLCSATLKSGKRKNETCGAKVSTRDEQTCKRHRLT